MVSRSPAKLKIQGKRGVLGIAADGHRVVFWRIQQSTFIEKRATAVEQGGVAGVPQRPPQTLTRTAGVGCVFDTGERFGRGCQGEI